MPTARSSDVISDGFGASGRAPMYLACLLATLLLRSAGASRDPVDRLMGTFGPGLMLEATYTADDATTVDKKTRIDAITPESQTGIGPTSADKEMDVSHLKEEAHDTMDLMDEALKRGDVVAVRALGKRERDIMALKALKESQKPIDAPRPAAESGSADAQARGAPGTDDQQDKEGAIATPASAAAPAYGRLCRLNATAELEDLLQQLRSCAQGLRTVSKAVEGSRLQSRDSNNAMQEELRQVGRLLAKVQDKGLVDAAFGQDQAEAARYLLEELSKTDTEIAKLKAGQVLND